MNLTFQAAIFAVASTLAFAGPILTVVDLGTLGGSSAAAFGVNASGLAVGSATNTFGYTHAFSSSGAGIADLTLNSGASDGVASAINGAGAIAGTQFINGQAYATVWAGGAALAIGGAGSYALAINESGQIGGMLTTAAGDGHAFLADGGALTDLGALPGGDWSSTYGLNNAGDAAGYGNTASGAFRGFTWSPDGGYSVLGTFGGANSYAMAINDSGEAAGSAQLADGALNAFIDVGGQLTDLGTLGGMNSYAYGINDAGVVVGYSLLGSGDAHAFVFENGAMIDLNSLIDPSTGWVLNEAYAINASGEIAGSGTLNGVEHAFLLEDAGSSGVADTGTVGNGVSTPEPGTRGVVLLGLTLTIAIRALRSGARLRPQPQARPRSHPRSDASLV
jgi:probable HAF family extracellular repeat protein